MRLHLNGEPRDTPHLANPADRAAGLDLPAFGRAIELNGVVIRRAEHAATPLRDGDRLEVVRLVGGG